MRISDWSSDVCSSDLIAHVQSGEARGTRAIAFAAQPMTGEAGVGRACIAAAQSDEMAGALKPLHRGRIGRAAPGKQRQPCKGANGGGRSEEHTSELQSLMRISYAVFCLKKNKQQQK